MAQKISPDTVRLIKLRIVRRVISEARMVMKADKVLLAKPNEKRHERHTQKQTNKLRGLSPRANYTDRAVAAGRRS